jgi:hypothetical protein
MCWTPLYANKYKLRKEDIKKTTGGKGQSEHRFMQK